METFIAHHVDNIATGADFVHYSGVMNDAARFAGWFNAQLRRRDWKQADFVERSQVSRQATSMWSTGRRVPDPASCDVIAEVFGLDLDLVLAVAGHRPVITELPLDDPRRHLVGLIERTELSSEQVSTLETLLTAWHERRRNQRG